ncbi:hypothetical protein DICSQDRAFT_58038 [Dichomitus squalens LYAD-421 SS1]|uniref:uncharacterized protein n=1 Tax=Dichomitus squalens (strain LYAD-421) TaxID=732165 RepID=UPI0004415DB3|nr:uncharacterized protein DICSQDRAFT_58038 [Dichomitus squalens LYAD-421 SS1]EJF62684.1 hypothetical protein DICSQDRAFT_58038 [Dichomitus squalens LYAD-421 SS1]
MEVDSAASPTAIQTTAPEGKKRARGSEEKGHGGGQPGSASRSRRSHKVRKLAPPRPVPTVAPSVSATGPRSAHTEGKNYICITRRTELGAYLRRCKDVFLQDGYKTLYLSAMGAAIPHLMQLALSLPTILPYPRDEIHTEILTGTVHVHDELIPEDEEEDIIYRTRGKSTVSVVIKIGDGVNEPTAGAAKGSGKKNNLGRAVSTKGGGKPMQKDVTRTAEPIVIREDELDDS